MVSSLFLLAFLQAWVGGYWLKDAGKCQVLLGIVHSITLMRTLGLWDSGPMAMGCLGSLGSVIGHWFGMKAGCLTLSS